MVDKRICVAPCWLFCPYSMHCNHGPYASFACADRSHAADSIINGTFDDELASLFACRSQSSQNIYRPVAGSHYREMALWHKRSSVSLPELVHFSLPCLEHALVLVQLLAGSRRSMRRFTRHRILHFGLRSPASVFRRQSGLGRGKTWQVQ